MSDRISKLFLTDENGDAINSGNPFPVGASSKYLVEIARGNIPGQEGIAIGGINPDMAQDVEETIWDQGGIYTYLTADTQLLASSSNAGDTQLIIVEGMDDTFTRVTRTVTLTGQTQVALDDLLFRVFDAFVFDSVEPSGDIYIAESDTLTGGVPDTAAKIKAKIVQGNNTSEMCIYTIPTGKTGFAISDNFISGKGDEIIYRPLVRPFGGVFIQSGRFNLYQSAVEFTLPFITAPEKSDIEFRGTSTNPNAVGASFLDFILIDN